MADKFSNRGSNIVCSFVTNVIVVVGVLAFMYFGQQMSHGIGKSAFAVDNSKTPPLVNSVGYRD